MSEVSEAYNLLTKDMPPPSVVTQAAQESTQMAQVPRSVSTGTGADMRPKVAEEYGAGISDCERHRIYSQRQT
jgi:hypothetical protein